MKFGAARLDELLLALGEQLRRESGAAVGLVVCGGSALAALGLVTRTTRDVDVLGLADTGSGPATVFPLRELPASVAAAAGRVARDFGLAPDWLNVGPARQVEAGLPEGLADRLVRREYGPGLSVFFVGRLDQVHLKLYAAVDRDDYHTQDLIALRPSPDELLAAARWTMTQDVSAAFRGSLKAFLVAQGYEDVAGRV